MISAVANQVEELLKQLPYQERLRLIEQLAQRLIEDAPATAHDWQSEMALLAADPQIQAELRAIEQELAVTEKRLRMT